MTRAPLHLLARTIPSLVLAWVLFGPAPASAQVHDLAATGVTFFPSTVPQGNPIDITATVENLGGFGENFRIDFILSADPIITTTKPILGSRFNVTVGPGQTAQVTARMPAPASVTGNFHIGTFVDRDRQIPESVVNNNASASQSKITIVLGNPVKPDLTTENIGAPANGFPAGTLVVSGTVRNLSNFASSISCNAEFVLSLDPMIAPPDPIIGSTVVGALNPGANQSFSGLSATIPAGLALGTYFVGFRADTSDAVAETDEGNNGNSAPVQLNVTAASGGAKPDLIAELVSGDVTATIGGNIKVSGTIRNLSSSVAAGPSRADFLLSLDTALGPPDPPLNSVSVGGLGVSGAQQFQNVTFTVPQATQPGNYFIGLVADSQNAIDESNEGNNTAVSGATVGVGAGAVVPDLVVDRLAAPGTSPLTAPLNVGGAIRNVGAGSAPASTCKFILSIDTIVSASDSTLGQEPVPALGPQALHDLGTRNYGLPTGIAPGTYFVGLIADSQNQVAEGNESNNSAFLPGPTSLSGGGGGGTLPDLVSSGVGGGTTVTVGGTLDVFGRVTNQGASPSAACSANFVLSPDGTIDAGDVRLTTLPLQGLQTSAFADLNGRFDVTGAISPGSYFIGLFADPFGQVPESNEANNGSAAASQTSVRPAGFGTGPTPDLSPLAVFGPPRAPAGAVVDFAAIVLNSGPAGAPPFSTAFFLSPDASITVQDLYLGSAVSNGLTAGTTQPQKALVTIPSFVAPGRYILGAIVDERGAVPEGNETNNAFAGPSADIVAPDASVSLPDLLAENVNGPGGAQANGPITVVGSVRNVGGAAVGRFQVGFGLAPDPGFNTLQFLGDVPVDGLPPSGQAPIQASFFIPGTLAPNNYFLGMEADTTETVREANEGNNLARAPNAVPITAGGGGTASSPDLVATGVNGGSAGQPGGSLAALGVVANRGAGASPGFSVRFVLSPDQAISSADVGFGSLQVGGLPAGQQTTPSGSFTLPSALFPGDYVLGLVVDPENLVFESSESNNAIGAAASVRVSPVSTANLADLAAVFVSGPASELAGRAIGITGSVKNVGQAEAGAFNVAVLLSTDGQFGPQASLLGAFDVPSLPAGREFFLSQSVALPPSLAAGNYSLLLLADPTNTVAEALESNNRVASRNPIAVGAAAGPLTCTGASCPDLSMSNLIGPPAVQTGSTLAVSAEVKNSGGGQAGPFVVSFFLSNDAAVSADDAFIGARTFSGLPPGASAPFQALLPVSAAIASGNYFVGAEVDSTGTVAESSEVNNRFIGQARLSVSAVGSSGADLPDLIGDGLGAPPSLLPGTPIALTGVVRNTGKVAAGPFDVGFALADTSRPLSEDDLIKLGTAAVASGLAVGTVISVAGTFPVPPIPPGTYAVGMNVDAFNRVSEGNELNNVFVSPGVVSVFAPGGQSNLPDLLPEFVRSPSAGTPGLAIDVQGSIRNGGAVDAGAFSVLFVLTTGFQPSALDPFLGKVAVASLAAGRSLAVGGASALAVPSAIAPGGYHAGLVIDPEGRVAESFEGNNGLAAPSLVVVGGGAASASLANLVASPPTAPLTAALGGTIALSGRVQNSGAVPSGAFAASFVLEGVTGAAAALTPNGIAFRVASVPVASLATGASVTVDGTFQLPSTLPPGSYRAVLEADSNFTVPEAQEGDNRASAITATVIGGAASAAGGLPDLILTDLSSPKQVTMGSLLPVSATVRNLGGRVTAAFGVGFGLSATRIPGRDVIGVGLQIVQAPLEAGATAVAGGSFPLPPFVAPGNYFCVALADDQNFVAETNEANNGVAATSATTIGAGSAVGSLPDLVTAGVFGPPGALANQTVGLSADVQNRGVAPAGPSSGVFGLTLSGPSGPAAAGTALGTVACPPVPPGGLVNVRGTFTIPLSVAPGVYVLTFEADSANGVIESSETNNRSTAANPLQIGGGSGRSARIEYSQEPFRVGAGKLLIRAFFSEPVQGRPAIAVDRPGDGNDVRAGEMTPVGATEFSFEYTVASQDGKTIFDGPGFVTLTAKTATGESFPPPIGGTFNIVTSGGADLVPTALLISPPAPANTERVRLAVSVANRGSAPVGSVGVVFVIDGAPRRRDTISLGPNSATTLTELLIEPLPVGLHRVAVVVDPEGLLPEVDEFNNRLERTFGVSSITAGVKTAFLVVSGTVRSEAGRGAGSGLSVVVTNNRSGQARTGAVDASGRYSAVFNASGGADAAVSGDSLGFQLQDATGHGVGLALPNPPRLTLTDSQVQASLANVDLLARGEGSSEASEVEVLRTVAGTGQQGFSADGGSASGSALVFPIAPVFFKTGDLYFCDAGTHRVRRVDAKTGLLSTIAGTGKPGSSGDAGAATAALLNEPEAIALDSSGNVYIAERAGHRVRLVDAKTGKIQTVLGTGTAGQTFDATAPSASAIRSPSGLVLDSAGNLYVADTGNHRVLVVKSGATLKRLAGTGEAGFSGDGGAAASAKFSSPRGLAIDSSGNLLVADMGNHRVRKIDLGTETVFTIAGDGAAGFSGELLPATASSLNQPTGVAVDPSTGEVLIADSGNNRVRELDANGRLESEVGNGVAGRAGDGSVANRAAIRKPRDVTFDLSGNLVFADSGNDRILRVGLLSSGRADEHPASATAVTTAHLLATDGTPTSATLEVPGDIDAFQFQGVAGELFTIEVFPSGGSAGGSFNPVDTILTLIGTDGSTVIAENDDAPSGGAFVLASNKGAGASGSRLEAIPLPVAGTYFVRVRGFGTQTVGSYTVAVRRGRSSGTLQLSTEVLPPAFSGTAYTPLLTVTGGKAPFTFSVLGTLPPGLALDLSTGAFSGSPARLGQFGFGIEVTDGAGATARRSYRIDVLPGGGQRFPESSHPYAVRLDETKSFTLPGAPAAIDVSFDPATAVEPGRDFIHVRNASDTDIAGSPFSGRDLAGRTVRVKGDTVRIRLVSDQNIGGFGYRVASVDPAFDGKEVVKFVTSVLPPASVGTPYSSSLATTGGQAPLVFSVAGGALPQGLSLGASGALTGTPTAPGDYAFVAGVREAGGGVGSRRFLLPVLAVGGAQFPESAHPYADNSDETVRHTLAGGPQSILVTFDPRTFVEPGYDLIEVSDSTGRLVGRFTGDSLAGRTLLLQGATVQVRLISDRKIGFFGYRVTRIAVAQASGITLAISSSSLSAGRVGVSYAATIVTTGGLPPYRYSVTGALPAGLVLVAETGQLLGKPSRAGSFTFKMTARDSATPAGTVGRDFTIGVTAVSAPKLSLAFSNSGDSLSASVVVTSVSSALDGVRLFVQFDPSVLAYERFVLGDAAGGNSANVLAQAQGLLEMDIPAPPSLTKNGTLATLLFRVTGAIDSPGRAVVLANSTFGAQEGKLLALRPTANAGLGQTVFVKTTAAGAIRATLRDLLDPSRLRPWITLDGRKSADPNTPPSALSYAWTQVTSFPVTLSSAASATPTFVTTMPGVYLFSLVTNNGLLDSFPASVRIVVDAGGCAPTADPRVLDRETGARSDPAGTPPRVVASAANVTLDATLSSAGAKQDAGKLSYRWSQVAGPSVQLAPSSTTVQPVFFPAEAGVYDFELVARGPRGCDSAPQRVRVVALESGNTAPSLSLQASATTTTAVGDDLGDGVEGKLTRSLRVTLPSRVTLKAAVVDPDVGTAPLKQRLTFEWSQLSGPVVALTTSVFNATEALVSTVEFEPTTSRVHVLRCVVSELSSSGSPTGVQATRDVRVVVSDPSKRVPEAAFLLLDRKTGTAKGYYTSKDRAPLAAAETSSTVELDGTSSVSASDGAVLAYQWVQVSGPAVELSNPFSVATTFVVPDLGDDVTRQYRFALVVDDSGIQSEPAVGGVQVTPSTTRTAAMDLGRGFTLVSFPVSPSTTDARGYTLGELMDRAGANFLVRTESGRFRVVFRSAAEAAMTVEPGTGYLVGRKSAKMRMTVKGRSWSESLRPRLRARAAGFNIIAYPATTVPSTFDVEALRRLSGADFVTRFNVNASGVGTNELYLPGSSGSFAVEPGAAYLLSIPASRSVTLPDPPE